MGAHQQLPPDRPGPSHGRAVDGGKEILATFGDRLSEKAARSCGESACRSGPGPS